jgi:Asp-tRNA(Asn)/Glu-tRNA(Gln) amidotransferase A subunit family amidase
MGHHTEPVEPQPDARRLIGWLSRSCVHRHGRDGARQRRRRINPIPAGLTGLVGLKPQRDRIPVGDEHGSAWHGLITLGPLTRSARDAALFLDVASNSPSPTPVDDPHHEPPRPLTIAVATNPPPGANVSLTPDGQAIITDCCEALRKLGHTVIDARLGSRIRRPCCGLWRPRRRGLGRRDGSRPWKPPTHLVGVRPSHQVFDQLALD